MKNKIVTGVLAFFVGVFGVHRFYLGEVGKGILYAVFFWTPVVWIVAIIDAIVFLTMDDEIFNYKYNKDYYQQRPRENRRPEYRENRRPQYNTEGRASYNNYEDNPKGRFEERQRERERLKQQKTQEPAPIKKNNPFKDEGTKLYRDYDFKGAIKAYQKALKVNPRDSVVHFNLACLYSLEEDLQHSYLHLSKAVENGFSMYDKIREHDHLAFLRTDDGFDAFVANGYRMPGAYAQQPIQQLPPRKEDEIDLMSDEVIRKLEQLGKLKERGILTEAEFNLQKAKLLKKR